MDHSGKAGLKGDATRPTAVLDTNVVLDWLVFRDPAVASLARAITTGTLRWLASPRMRDEFARVLGHGALARWSPDPGSALAEFDGLSDRCHEPPGCRLTCRDSDDQIFVDLAAAAGCRWLVSRDRALLALARRAGSLGVTIVTPARWAPIDPAR